MHKHDKETKSSEPVAAEGGANPLLVELTRGDMVESVHRARYAVVDNDGRVVLQAGDIEAPVYGRSAIKSLQAIPLIETGAAEAFGLEDPEISMACASHDGEARHVATVLAWLERIGCSVDDLECGAHLPYDPASLEALLRSGSAPTAAHNNCSGKHSGFLTTARHKGEPTKGYIRRDHPVQQRILGVLEAMTGLDLSRVPMGIDGCGIPVIGIPLGNIALAMARLGSPDDQPDRRQAACARIRKAIANEPVMMGGTKRFDSRIIAAIGGKAIVKTGAEGVYCGTVPDLGLGFAVKVDDGAGRASEIVAGALLRRLGVIDDQQAEALSELLRPDILNRAGREVGVIRAASAARF